MSIYKIPGAGPGNLLFNGLQNRGSDTGAGFSVAEKNLGRPGSHPSSPSGLGRLMGTALKFHSACIKLNPNLEPRFFIVFEKLVN